jgi:hypothetical protein
MTLLFQGRITQKNVKFNKSENFSIPGAVSREFVLLKGGGGGVSQFNNAFLTYSRAEIVQ